MVVLAGTSSIWFWRWALLIEAVCAKLYSVLPAQARTFIVACTGRLPACLAALLGVSNTDANFLQVCLGAI